MSQMIPYIAHESEMMRMEKHERRLFIALLMAIIILIISNLLWMLYSRKKGYEGGTHVHSENAEYVDGDKECKEDN